MSNNENSVAARAATTQAVVAATTTWVATPTPATTATLAAALSAKAAALAAHIAAGGNAPARGKTGLVIQPGGVKGGTEKAALLKSLWAEADARGDFPEGARLNIQGDRQVAEDSGFNALLSPLYEVTGKKAVQALCTPQWFADVSAAIRVCQAAGMTFGFWGVGLDADEPVAKAFVPLYEEAKKAGTWLPPLRYTGRKVQEASAEEVAAFMAKQAAERSGAAA